MNDLEEGEQKVFEISYDLNKQKKSEENPDTEKFANENAEVAGMTAKVMGPNVTLKELGTNDTLWVGNSGASWHMGKSSKGLVSTRASTRADTFILGNDARAQAATVGDLMGCGGATKIKVSDVSYCLQAKFNIFSLSAMLNKG